MPLFDNENDPWKDFQFRRCLAAESTHQQDCIRRLWAIGRTDPIVARSIEAWMRGDFPTFESMLCHLVVTLAEVKERLVLESLRNARLQIPPSVIMTPQENVDALLAKDSKEKTSDE